MTNVERLWQPPINLVSNNLNSLIHGRVKIANLKRFVCGTIINDYKLDLLVTLA